MRAQFTSLLTDTYFVWEQETIYYKCQNPDYVSVTHSFHPEGGVCYYTVLK